MALKLEEGETVVMGWVEWPDRETRDAGNKRMMEDPRMVKMGEMPFDGMRMIYGVFEVLLDCRSCEGAATCNPAVVTSVSPTAQKRLLALHSRGLGR